MGKASKWIINLLLGRKEDKFKQIDSPEKKNGNNGSQIVSPKVKRRWSFGKLTGGKITSKVTGHKISRSFNSSDSAKLQIQALFETKSSRRIPTSLPKSSKRNGVKTAAATTIQAAFRSYLARKALHALRGLVKLQALVRGHLVRKQTTATLRGMHALMAIQVRARINRIQMVEEANLLAVQPPQYRETPHFKGLIKENDSKDMSLEEMLEILKSRSGPLDDSDVTSRGHDSMAFYSKQMSASKRENQFKGNTFIIDPNNSPGNYQTISEMNPTTTVLSTQRHQVPHRQSWSPNYMNKTESSKAKVRSQSEPRQRPKRGTRHKSKSVESPSNGPSQHLFTNSSRFDQGSLDHWVINVHESMKDNKRDSFGSSTATSDWYY